MIYSTSGSCKTSFIESYSNQNLIVFGGDDTEFHYDRLHLEKFDIESPAIKTISSDDAGAHKNLKTKVEDLFRFGRFYLSCTLCKACSPNSERELF